MDTNSKAILLKLTASGIDRYCEELARRSPSLEKQVAALDALATFVLTQTDSGEQAKAEFAAIKQTLQAHFERARQALLAERAQGLRRALVSQKLSAIAAIYTSVSRDAFWTLLGAVEQDLGASERTACRQWASGWLAQAKQRAQEASGYPDAVDFAAAGIDVVDYAAMTDVCRYFGDA